MESECQHGGSEEPEKRFEKYTIAVGRGTQKSPLR